MTTILNAFYKASNEILDLWLMPGGTGPIFNTQMKRRRRQRARFFSRLKRLAAEHDRSQPNPQKIHTTREYCPRCESTRIHFAIQATYTGEKLTDHMARYTCQNCHLIWLDPPSPTP